MHKISQLNAPNNSTTLKAYHQKLFAHRDVFISEFVDEYRDGVE
jgi:hypothetical protein